MLLARHYGLHGKWRQLAHQSARRLTLDSRRGGSCQTSAKTGTLRLLTAAAPPATVTLTATENSLTEGADSVQILDERSAPEKLRDISTLIFDCDGVLWRGSEIIRNAPEALRIFRQQGKRLLFVTNNSSKSRAEYSQKFRGLGLEVTASEIVSSSYCAAAYLTSIGFGAGADATAAAAANVPRRGRKVLLLGWSGVELELEAAGIPYIGGRNFPPLPAMNNIDAMNALQVDPDIGAVVVGWDPSFSYDRLVYASICLRELPGCLLVATNMDCADHIGAGRMMPGTGGLVRAVEVASGVQAVNVAKGGEWLLPYLCSMYGLEPSRTAIIGDRMDTDIFLGRQGGLFTCLPLTGVTTLERLRALPASELPDVVVQSMPKLAGLE